MKHRYIDSRAEPWDAEMVLSSEMGLSSELALSSGGMALTGYSTRTQEHPPPLPKHMSVSSH